MSDLVVCETTAAITTHVRRISDRHPIALSGHRMPRPLTLCGVEAAWDTKQPVTKARCGSCLAELESEAA